MFVQPSVYQPKKCKGSLISGRNAVSATNYYELEFEKEKCYQKQILFKMQEKNPVHIGVVPGVCARERSIKTWNQIHQGPGIEPGIYWFKNKEMGATLSAPPTLV